MNWWPCNMLRRYKRRAQRQQIEESMRRITLDGKQKVESAKERLETASSTTHEIVSLREEKSAALRNALIKIIDQQSGGRFRMHKAGRD